MNDGIDKPKLSSFLRDILEGKERTIKGISYKVENDRLMWRVWRDNSGCGLATFVWLPAQLDLQTVLDFCNPSLGPVGFNTGVISNIDNLFQEV